MSIILDHVSHTYEEGTAMEFHALKDINLVIPDGQFIGLTVAEDIAFALENSCTPQDEMHEITRRAAELVGIEDHLEFAPHELSGGQKQRVSLAGVMVDEVKILLFDEPLANLDPAAGKQTIELIDEIQKKTGTTVVIIEHRLEDVLWRDVDRIILVSEGEIVADMPNEKWSVENKANIFMNAYHDSSDLDGVFYINAHGKTDGATGSITAPLPGLRPHLALARE